MSIAVLQEEIANLRARLARINPLAPRHRFLERAARLAADERMDADSAFSHQLSALISKRRAPWSHVAKDLLRAKVQAEVEIGTHL